MSNSLETLQDQAAGAPFDAYSTKRVSYILTTKNRASLADSSLAAVREYITPEDELIVVDGLSEDETCSVISRNSDIVDKFISEADAGAAHALNKGMLIARGRYIRPVSDDDILHPEALEQAIQVLDQHPKVDVIVCGGTKQYTGERPFEVWLPPGVQYGKSTEDVFRYKGSGAGFIIRRSALPLTGLIPTSLPADLEFLLQAIRRGATIRFCRIKLYHHAIHSDSHIIKYHDDHLKDTYRLLRQYCSLRFYVYIRIKWFLRRHQRWGNFAEHCGASIKLPRRIWNKGLRMLRSEPAILAPTRASKPRTPDRWDGGFS